MRRVKNIWNGVKRVWWNIESIRGVTYAASSFFFLSSSLDIFFSLTLLFCSHFFLLVEEDEDVWKKKMGKKKYLMEKKMCATGKTFIPSWKTLRKWWRCEMVLVVDDGNVIHVFCANKRFLLVAWLDWLLAKNKLRNKKEKLCLFFFLFKGEKYMKHWKTHKQTNKLIGLRNVCDSNLRWNWDGSKEMNIYYEILNIM